MREGEVEKGLEQRKLRKLRIGGFAGGRCWCCRRRMGVEGEKKEGSRG